MKEIFIGRQPIIDRKKRIFGYELLFRDSRKNYAKITDPTKATAHVLMEMLIDMGIENLVGKKKAFINGNEEILQMEFLDLLKPEKVVFEILEDQSPNERLKDLIIELKKAQYLFALDDFSLTSDQLELLPFVDFVKVDIRNLKKEELESAISSLRKEKARIIAEKVEREKEFKFLFDLGCDFFQGYFFSEPSILRKRTIPSNKTYLLEILNALQEEKEQRTIEEIFKKHPDLSYRLLRFINSAFFYLSEPIRSIGHAISLLGYSNVRKWALLLLFGLDDEDPTTNPLFEISFVRGFMLEELSKESHLQKPLQESAFLTGSLSVIDALFQIPLKEILKSVKIAPEIEEALLFEAGELGFLLKAIKYYEVSNNEKAIELLSLFGLKLDSLLSSEMKAILSFHSFEKNL